jgi:hypothetical protein
VIATGTEISIAVFLSVRLLYAAVLVAKKLSEPQLFQPSSNITLIKGFKYTLLTS